MRSSEETKRMLATFTIDAATELVGTRFRVTAPDGTSVEMTLTDALVFETPLRRSARKSGIETKRKPFSIYFVGPPQPILPQAMYRFESERLTFENLFIVPLGNDAQGTEYEAVFT
jgi:hypothetical protein